MPQKNNLFSSTVVVTGASSGIGRATALAFAKEGANIILASRNVEALIDVATQCREAGSEHTLVVPTDITDAHQVNLLAQQAASAFNGRIDVWVNDPGVGALGTYDQVPMESHAQVIAINLVGYMNGVHSALHYMKKQNRGVIINMNSVGAFIPSPYAASYSASKFGLRGFSEAIKAEITSYPDVHICDVYPTFVSSPAMKHSANYTGVQMRPMPPFVSPERVAQHIVSLAKNPKSKKMVGVAASLARFFGTPISPFISRLMGKGMEYHMRTGKRVPFTDGNLYAPTDSATTAIEGTYGVGIRVLNSVARISGFALLGAIFYKGTRKLLVRGKDIPLV